MVISKVDTETINGSVYKAVTIKGNKNKYSFTKVSGKLNYIAIRKAVPGAMLGKEFKNFDQAQKAYKQAEIKTFILLAETLLR